MGSLSMSDTPERKPIGRGRGRAIFGQSFSGNTQSYDCQQSFDVIHPGIQEAKPPPYPFGGTENTESDYQRYYDKSNYQENYYQQDYDNYYGNQGQYYDQYQQYQGKYDQQGYNNQRPYQGQYHQQGYNNQQNYNYQQTRNQNRYLFIFIFIWDKKLMFTLWFIIDGVDTNI